MHPNRRATDDGRRQGVVWHRVWWGPLFGLVATVGLGHAMVLVLTRLRGEVAPQEFDLGGFALTWTLVAAAISAWDWWDTRRQQRRRKREPDDAPILSRITSSALFVCWTATWFSSYMTAFDGELPLIWADTLTAFTFALAAFGSRAARSIRSTTPLGPGG
ncbi:hypothetical protein [Actinoplanes solisilvae]|uniref:hypothetical protein n=1 Tax=Actinoplanes solisilvae TaxID=2486853 RepID=UPI000FDA3772|nr:hypothetical protein [Actinoplanes solisilvae]